MIFDLENPVYCKYVALYDKEKLALLFPELCFKIAS